VTYLSDNREIQALAASRKLLEGLEIRMEAKEHYEEVLKLVGAYKKVGVIDEDKRL
jgi:hypothetical protein